MSGDDNIHKLPVRKRLGQERTLEIVGPHQCLHQRFVIDERKAEIECNDCGEAINPMWALSELARQENRWHELHRRYQDELRRLSERSRTKCRHCGKMTEISRR